MSTDAHQPDADSRWYGLCPAQLDGITHDGRPFYFRSRGGTWTLHVGECGWVPNILGWPEYGDHQLAARGDVALENPDAIDALVTQTLGAGWRHVSPEETWFRVRCDDCGEVFETSSGDCMSCLVERHRTRRRA